MIRYPFDDKKRLLNAIDMKIFKRNGEVRVEMSLQAEEEEGKPKQMTATLSVTDDVDENILNWTIKRLKKQLVDSYLHEFVSDEDIRTFVMSLISEAFRAKQEESK